MYVDGYQYVKKIAVNGNPTVILSVAGVVGALPSLPCKLLLHVILSVSKLLYIHNLTYDTFNVTVGARATLRNAGLAVALASVLIYPDHLSSYFNSKVSATNASPK